MISSTFRIASIAVFAATLTTGLNAQDSKPTTQPAPADTDSKQGPPAPVDPDMQSGETDEQRRQKIVDRIATLKARLARVKGNADNGGLVAVGRQALGNRTTNPKMFDAPMPAPPKIAPARKPVVLDEDASKSYGNEVICLINGGAVRKADVVELADYVHSTGQDIEEGMAQSMAFEAELRRVLAQRLSGSNTGEAEKRIQGAKADLERGISFEQIAKAESSGPGREQGGDLGSLRRNSPYGLHIEREAFALQAGERSGIFTTPLGYAIVMVSGRNKAESPATETVDARLILIPYLSDIDEVQQLQGTFDMGRAEIVFPAANKDWMQRLPARYQG